MLKKNPLSSKIKSRVFDKYPRKAKSRKSEKSTVVASRNEDTVVVRRNVVYFLDITLT